MLHRSVPERALGALLGGELAATELYRHLADRHSCSGQPFNIDRLRKDLRTAIQRDIDCRTGGSLRLNETETAVDDLCGQALLCTPNMESLDTAFDAVLEFSDEGTIQFKNIHVQRYAELLAELDATVLVAWRLIRQSESKGHGKLANLGVVVDRLSTLFVGPQFDADPFAENHVHLAGITGNELVLSHVVLGQTLLEDHQSPEKSHNNEVSFDVNEQITSSLCAEKEPSDLLRRIRRIRRVLASLVALWNMNGDFTKKVIKGWVSEVLPTIPDVGNEATPDAQIDWGTIKDGLVLNGENKAQICNKWLLRKLADAASGNQFQTAWIWLFLALWRTYRSVNMNDTARTVVLLVITDVMVLRRRLLMDGNGLRRFTTQCFASPLRDMAKKRMGWEMSTSREVAQRLFARQGDKAAIKVGLDTLRGDAWLLSLASDVNAIIREREGDPRLSHERSREHWHLCAHFNRIRKEQSRADLWKSAKTLRDVLYSDQAWPLSKLADGGEQTEFQVSPSQLIRGLDVVGDETRWPIERFAPMIRWLRSDKAAPEAPLCLPAGLEKRPKPGLHLSIHAGEDYAHPLSGLRHVDETVEFCEMRKGDRLGHALALGIPPNEWLQRHGDVTLPLDEHVDNLVWAWHQATLLPDLAEAKLVLPRAC